MNCEFKRKLPIPMEIKELHPMTFEMQQTWEKRDKEIKRVLSGESDKFLLIIGPCSADYEDSVIDYISRLRKVQDKVEDKIIIIPRIYTNKPRTTGDGYKGMLHQPNPLEDSDMLEGLIKIRKVHMRALKEYGFTCADEMLYPENYRYLSDILAYVAVGARSTENQQHRLTASAIGVPVGMKNSTSGDLTVMMNSITAAQHEHTFIYRGWEVNTFGNKYAHAILRGGMNIQGENIANYHYEDLMKVLNLYKKSGLENMGVIIDCNHANSNKQYLEQIRISKDVLGSMKANPELRKLVKGLMIESYIEDGRADASCAAYGQSITDPCLGWEKTEQLIYDIAEML